MAPPDGFEVAQRIRVMVNEIKNLRVDLTNLKASESKAWTKIESLNSSGACRYRIAVWLSTYEKLGKNQSPITDGIDSFRKEISSFYAYSLLQCSIKEDDLTRMDYTVKGVKDYISSQDYESAATGRSAVDALSDYLDYLIGQRADTYLILSEHDALVTGLAQNGPERCKLPDECGLCRMSTSEKDFTVGADQTSALKCIQTSVIQLLRNREQDRDFLADAVSTILSNNKVVQGNSQLEHLTSSLENQLASLRVSCTTLDGLADCSVFRLGDVSQAIATKTPADQNQSIVNGIVAKLHALWTYLDSADKEQAHLDWVRGENLLRHHACPHAFRFIHDRAQELVGRVAALQGKYEALGEAIQDLYSKDITGVVLSIDTLASLARTRNSAREGAQAIDDLLFNWRFAQGRINNIVAKCRNMSASVLGESGQHAGSCKKDRCILTLEQSASVIDMSKRPKDTPPSASPDKKGGKGTSDHSQVSDTVTLVNVATPPASTSQPSSHERKLSSKRTDETQKAIHSFEADSRVGPSPTLASTASNAGSLSIETAEEVRAKGTQWAEVRGMELELEVVRSIRREAEDELKAIKAIRSAATETPHVSIANGDTVEQYDHSHGTASLNHMEMKSSVLSCSSESETVSELDWDGETGSEQ